MAIHETNSDCSPKVRRVVQILPELDDGGVERGVVELNRELVSRGIESWVISDGGAQIPKILDHGGHHLSFDVNNKNPFTVLTRAIRLRAILNNISPDVIHARSRVPAWLCCMANRIPRRPFVTTVHGLNSVSWYSRVMISGDRVITVSDIVRDHVCKGYGVEPSMMTVIQRGVDLTSFSRSAIDAVWSDNFRREHKLTGRFVVTSVGRVTWLKDYETFIRSIARCVPEIPEIIGLIVGGTRPNKRNYLDELQTLARNEGVGDRIIFAGMQSHMPEIYAMSDVLVNASLKMGNMGRTVVESLAMETPVISTTWPGLENLVRNGVNGQIIENQSPEQMAAAIREIRSSDYTTPQRRLAIRESIPAEYTLDSMVDRIVKVYESAVSG